MNHGVMALAGETIVKVRCNTCMNEHPYRHGKSPKKKDPITKAYEELLAKTPGMPKPPLPKKPPEE